MEENNSLKTIAIMSKPCWIEAFAGFSYINGNGIIISNRSALPSPILSI